MTTSQEPTGAPGMMVWPLVAIGAVLGGLAGGFVTHNLPVAAACALLGAGGVGILAWQAIGRLAQEQEYADWVAQRGWQQARNLPAALVTSLLRAGDTRRLEDGFEGEIEGRTAGIGHFIWETVERSVDEHGNVHETRIPHTATVLETLTGLQVDDAADAFAAAPRPGKADRRAGLGADHGPVGGAGVGGVLQRLPAVRRR
jgi:hypothetical protein